MASMRSVPYQAPLATIYPYLSTHLSVSLSTYLSIHLYLLGEGVEVIEERAVIPPTVRTVGHATQTQLPETVVTEGHGLRRVSKKAHRVKAACTYRHSIDARDARSGAPAYVSIRQQIRIPA
jgi:hypothetical protein